jgi:hypothetical protein
LSFFAHFSSTQSSIALLYDSGLWAAPLHGPVARRFSRILGVLKSKLILLRWDASLLRSYLVVNQQASRTSAAVGSNEIVTQFLLRSHWLLLLWLEGESVNNGSLRRGRCRSLLRLHKVVLLHLRHKFFSRQGTRGFRMFELVDAVLARATSFSQILNHRGVLDEEVVNIVVVDWPHVWNIFTVSFRNCTLIGLVFRFLNSFLRLRSFVSSTVYGWRYLIRAKFLDDIFATRGLCCLDLSLLRLLSYKLGGSFVFLGAEIGSKQIVEFDFLIRFYWILNTWSLFTFLHGMEFFFLRG